MWLTIIVVLYNQEKYICDCLNSIKYQIENYNCNKYKVQVIIADDASRDSSEAVAKEWLQKNGSVFDEWIYERAVHNRGTCQNYLNALEKSKGDYIKAIGGDDLFPANSIFQIIEYLDEYDIVYGNPVIVAENNSIEDTLQLYSKTHIINKEEAKVDFTKRIHRYCSLIGPATYVSKELLTHPKVIGLLQEYKYIDDYTQWLKMSEIKDIRDLYLNESAIIYRRTGGSAYKKKADIVKEEISRIYQYAIEHAPDLWTKMIVKNYLYVMKRNHMKYIQYFSLVNWLHKIYSIRNMFADSNGNRSEVEQNYEYLKKIMSEQI